MSFDVNPDSRLASREGMDSRFAVNRDELYNVQMELRQMQITQNTHGERISRLEKRQQDANLKSVWNSPFPSALSGTPQHGESYARSVATAGICGLT
jgi:hypothetical protein